MVLIICLVTQLEDVLDIDENFFSTKNPLENIMQNYFAELFQNYTSSRLCIAQKFAEEEQVNEYLDLEDDVGELDDQLMAIATVGRACCISVIPFLCHIMMDELSKLQHHQKLDTLSLYQERMRWILVIATYFVADPGEGEKPLVPRFLLRASAVSSFEDDPIIRLLNGVMQCVCVFLADPSQDQFSLCSPLMVETVFSFFSRFCMTYLYLDEDEYQRMRLLLILYPIIALVLFFTFFHTVSICPRPSDRAACKPRVSVSK